MTSVSALCSNGVSALGSVRTGAAISSLLGNILRPKSSTCSSSSNISEDRLRLLSDTVAIYHDSGETVLNCKVYAMGNVILLL